MPFLSQGSDDLLLALLFDPSALASPPKVCVTTPSKGYAVVSSSLQSYALRLITMHEMDGFDTSHQIDLYNSAFEPKYTAGESRKLGKYALA